MILIKRYSTFKTILILSVLILIFSILIVFLPFLFLLMILIHPILRIYFIDKYKLKHVSEETFSFYTQDGFQITIHKHKSKISKKKKNPLILCHGIVTNHYFMNLDSKHSMAEYFAEKGYDVYIPSLRGTHSSKHPKGEVDHSIDDIISDVGKIIDEVLKISGAKQVDWIGHSMGAMILYCHLATCSKQDSLKLRRFASLAGPGCLYNIHPSMAKLGLKYLKLIEKIDILKLGYFITPYISILPSSFRELSYTPQMTEKSTIKKMLFGLENIPRSMIQQFLQSVLLGGEIHSLDKKINYSRNFHKIQVPSLFIAANYDIVVPAHAVEFVFDRVSSKDKKFIYVSPENFSGSYGHACLVLGENSSKEIFPILEKFLSKIK